MKILYITAVNTSKPGSYMNHINGFIKSSKVFNDEFECWYPRTKNTKIINSHTNFCSVGIFNNYTLNALLFDFICSLKLLSKKNFDVVSIRPNPITILTFFTAWLKNYTIIKECNGILEYELRANKGILTALISRTVDTISNFFSSKIVCVSQGIKDYQSSINYTKTEIRVVSNGIDKDLINMDVPVKKIDKIKILFIGTFAPWQGLVEFLELIKQTESFNDTFEFHLAGSGALSKNNKFKQLIEETKTVYHGWCNPLKLTKIANDVHLGVIPRNPKQKVVGSPLKLFEYCGLGLGVLSTEIDGVINIDDLSKNIYFFDLNQDSFNKILEFLKNNKEDILSKGVVLNNIVSKFYTWENVYKKQFY